MKATFEVEFKDAQQAGQALRVVPPKKEKKARLTAELVPGKPSAIRYSIVAESFTSLRAHTTSLLRDLKVLRDTFELKEKQK